MNKFLLVLLVLLFIGCGQAATVDKFSPRVKNAYHSTCKVSGEIGAGTGILLDTGYILTAGHVVDKNFDGKLQLDEMECYVEFFSPNTAQVLTGTVIMIGDYINDSSQDVAVIALPLGSPRGSVSLISSETYDLLPYGEDVFTLGCPRGKSPKLFSGLLEYSDVESNIARASFTSIMGNSGGGVYSSNGNLIGIITENFGYYTDEAVNMLVPVPVEGGMMMIMGHGQVLQVHYAPNWSQFVTAGQVRTVLANHNMDFVIRPITKIVRANPFVIYFAILLNLILFVVLVHKGYEFWKILRS